MKDVVCTYIWIKNVQFNICIVWQVEWMKFWVLKQITFFELDNSNIKPDIIFFLIKVFVFRVRTNTWLCNWVELWNLQCLVCLWSILSEFIEMYPPQFVSQKLSWNRVRLRQDAGYILFLCKSACESRSYGGKRLARVMVF